MSIKKNTFILAMVSLIALTGQANATCPKNTTSLAVKGEIYDNAVAPGVTLGIVRMSGKNSRLDCAMMGNGGAGPDGSINFIHTLFCANNETTHSQLTLSTSGSGTFQSCDPENPAAGIHGTFSEISIPLSGRGIFQGVTAGKLVINGSINCQLAIDIQFEGEICLPN
jgi:hypothetical protein